MNVGFPTLASGDALSIKASRFLHFLHLHYLAKTGGLRATREGGVENGLHVDDISNALRTMLMNLKTLDWDNFTVDTLGIPAKMLQKVISNSEIIGNFLQDGQSQGSLYWDVLVINMQQWWVNLVEKVRLKAHMEREKELVNYALEGSIAIVGAVVQWLRDSLGIINSVSEIEELASKVTSTGGIYDKSHIARAVLGSMCFQVKGVLDFMHKDGGKK
ncbi:hypothetical protein HAX54_007725, partial [Datura stramonium]|nr:hypothetical protein [Datura stramonium]